MFNREAFRRPLTASDIESNTKAVKAIVETVIGATLPYKCTVEFIKSYTDSVLVILNGKQGIIGTNYCYFTPSICEKGDIVSVDKRYLRLTDEA